MTAEPQIRTVSFVNKQPKETLTWLLFIHITTGSAQTIDHFCEVTEKLAEAGPIDGLLAHAEGTSEKGFQVVSIWESKGHLDRFEAARLFSAFNASSLPLGTLMKTTSFTTFDSDYLAVPATR